MQLLPIPEAVSQARRAVQSVLSTWVDGGPAADAIVLLISEVVTNAVVHGGPHGEGDRVTLSVERRHDRVRVEVTDCHPNVPERGSAEPESPSGRGLLLVEALSSAWGVTPGRPGKTVWFEVSILS